jgi:hypothetical protein
MNDAKQGSAATATKSVPFKKMTPPQKLVFICKLAISALSFGFIYPHVWFD